jgi:hypothetical protein
LAAAPDQIEFWKSLPARIPARAQNAFALLQNYGANADMAAMAGHSA